MPKTVPSFVPLDDYDLVCRLHLARWQHQTSSNTHTSNATMRFQSSLFRENWEVACECELTIARGNPLIRLHPSDDSWKSSARG